MRSLFQSLYLNSNLKTRIFFLFLLSIIGLQINAQEAQLMRGEPAAPLVVDCIDLSIIDPDLNCVTLYDPVCGCNGLTYSNSCVAQTQYGITEWTNGPCNNPCNMTLAVSTIDYTCDGGSACIAIDGGQAPFSIVFSEPVVLNNNNEFCFANLAPGAYVVIVTDALGCTASLEFFIPIVDYFLEGVVSPVSCFGGNDGAIDIVVPIDVPLIFSWTGPNGFTANTEDISGLESGDYYVEVIYENGSCYSIGAFYVPQPDELIVDLEITNEDCDGVDACLTISGGTPGYHVFVWVYDGQNPLVEIDDQGNPTIDGTAPTDLVDFLPNPIDPMSYVRCAENVNPGTYVILVIDSNGCYELVRITIPNVSGIDADFEITSGPCDPEVDGCLNVTGGTGIYSIWVFDCLSPLPVFPVPVFDADNTPSVNGVPLSYFPHFDPVIFPGDDICAEDIPYGTYCLLIVDSNGCYIWKRIVIESYGLRIEGDVTHVSCNGDDEGAIDITVSGGSAPYYFEWSNGATTEDITGLAAGTYTVDVYSTDDFCTGTATFIVEEFDGIVTNCSWDPYGSFACVDPIGGTEPYTIVWYDLNSGDIINNNNEECIYDLEPGAYMVIVTDANGCEASEIFIVDEMFCLAGTVIIQPNEIQSGGTATFILFEWSGVSIQWQFMTDNTDWVDIPGATYSAYDSPAIHVGEDKVIKVRAIVTCPDGSILISDVAELYVFASSEQGPENRIANDRFLFDTENSKIVETAIAEVYPTVSNGPVTLRFNDHNEEATKISIQDLTGKVLKTRTEQEVYSGSQLNLDLSNFGSGMYLISIEQNGKINTHKVFKQ